MDIHSALDWRYAVREFSPEKLDTKIVENLLDATRKSASSYGLQPYKVIMIESQDLRRDLLPHSYGQHKVLNCSHLIVFAAETRVGDHTVDRYITQHQKVRDVSYSDVAGYADHMKKALAAKSEAEQTSWAHQQAYIALGTLLAASASMRIDSCPMTGIDARAYDQILGLNDLGLETSAIVALGLRSSRDHSSDLPKVRVDFDDFVIRR